MVSNYRRKTNREKYMSDVILTIENKEMEWLLYGLMFHKLLFAVTVKIKIA
jgi:hypothetical protein